MIFIDWLHILFVCCGWIVGGGAICGGLYVVVMLPFMLIGFTVGLVYSFFRLFLPFLPDFWEEKPSRAEKSGSRWYGPTVADKQRALNEHIRLQRINEDRNRRR